MLFRTVYGAELAAIYDFILRHTQTKDRVSLKDIYRFFVVGDNNSPRANHHVDDALSFLSSALLVDVDAGQVTAIVKTQDFRLQLLRNLRRLELGDVEPLHPLDPYYLYLLSEIFIKTGRQYVRDLHTEVNQLEPIVAAGGISREKVQVWKRVMTFLGIGYRAFNGFLCIYSPDLLMAILDEWPAKSDTLQAFFEDCVEQYVPTYTRIGELAPSLAASLHQLAIRDAIVLYPLQDSPSRAFFGPHQYKGIRKQTTYA